MSDVQAAPPESDRGGKSHFTWRISASFRWAARIGLALFLVVAVVVSPSRLPTDLDAMWPIQRDAATALQALKDNNFEGLSALLSTYRGEEDFAYFFTKSTSPRDLGDALATFAGEISTSTSPDRFDSQGYELFLIDLAGTLALATHDTSQYSLPSSWTEDFVAAMIDPGSVAEELDPTGDGSVELRARQDEANTQNLLLLLSRGYWSTEFLEHTTVEFWEFDRAHGRGGWSSERLPGAQYAQAPNGAYLSDGILALTAALTANPAASEWAFTDFLPGSRKVDGTDFRVGKFTYYLLFEHQFPTDADGESLGMTAALTALSSAVESAKLSTAGNGPSERSDDRGPAHDASVLQALVQHQSLVASCSWDPADYLNCLQSAIGAFFQWIKHWGHQVLEVLTLATFAPFPFAIVGIAAAGTNAIWYAVDGDYTAAGLSLASAVPGLAFPSIAKAMNAGAKALKVADVSRVRAQLAKLWKPKDWKNCDLPPQNGRLVITYGPNWSRAQRIAAERKIEAISKAAKNGELKKTEVVRTNVSPGHVWTKETGKKIKKGQDIDHTIDLQLGGADTVANMKPLDSTVNRSVGVKIARELKQYQIGDPITSIVICKA